MNVSELKSLLIEICLRETQARTAALPGVLQSSMEAPNTNQVYFQLGILATYKSLIEELSKMNLSKTVEETLDMFYPKETEETVAE